MKCLGKNKIKRTLVTATHKNVPKTLKNKATEIYKIAFTNRQNIVEVKSTVKKLFYFFVKTLCQ